MSKDIYFTIETCINKDGKKLRALEPDQDGWYNGVPVMVLDNNIITRNKTAYDAESVIQHINDPNNTFNQRLNDGDLFGEYNHPFIPSMNIKDPAVLTRMLWLDSRLKCVHYRKFEPDKDPDLNITMLYASLKPMGPYGQYAKEMLDDPYVNFSTSLRALSYQDKRPDGTLFRRIFKLITFDAGVPGGGYRYSSKRYAKISLENFFESVTHDGLLEIANSSTPTVSMESLFTDTELNELLKCSKINFSAKISAIKVDRDIFYLEDENKDRSVFHISKELL